MSSASDKWKAKLQKIWEEKKKHPKSDKKQKKKDKKRKKEDASPPSGRESDDSSSGVWVEAGQNVSVEAVDSQTDGPSKARRDAWMVAPIPGRSMFEKPTGKTKEENPIKRGRAPEYDPSRDARELNPFWKKGGAGLPCQDERRSLDKSPDEKEYEDDQEAFIEDEKVECQQEREIAQKPEEIITEIDLNKLGAKITRAEIMGDMELAEQLKSRLEEMRKAVSEGGGGSRMGGETVLLTSRDRQGNVRPLRHSHEVEKGRQQGRRRLRQKDASYDEGGKRTKYFADDDQYSLADLIKEEKLNTTEDYNKPLFRMTGRHLEKLNADFTLDDKFVSKAGKQMSHSKEKDAEEEKRQALTEHRRMVQSNLAIDSPQLEKERVVCVGLKVYLAVPPVTSLVPGHCQLIPCEHNTSSLNLDEDVWSEIKIFRKGLVAMFGDQGQKVVFIENAVQLHRHPHMVIECIPVPKEQGEVARLYFKKAILECETEWAQNKKLIDTREKELRRSIPKGLPYFSVEFGLGGGYAHVIEDDRTFQNNFGKEIIGGLLELEPYLWRKPLRESRDQQKHKAMKLAALWDAYDWTKKLNQDK